MFRLPYTCPNCKSQLNVSHFKFGHFKCATCKADLTKAFSLNGNIFFFISLFLIGLTYNLLNSRFSPIYIDLGALIMASTILIFVTFSCVFVEEKNKFNSSNGSTILNLTVFFLLLIQIASNLIKDLL